MISDDFRSRPVHDARPRAAGAATGSRRRRGVQLYPLGVPRLLHTGTPSRAPGRRPNPGRSRPAGTAPTRRQASQIDAHSNTKRRPTGRGRRATRRTCSGCMSSRWSVVADAPRARDVSPPPESRPMKHTLRRPRTTLPVLVKRGHICTPRGCLLCRAALMWHHRHKRRPE